MVQSALQVAGSEVGLARLVLEQGHVNGVLTPGIALCLIAGFLQPVVHEAAFCPLPDVDDLEPGNALLGPARDGVGVILLDLSVALFAFEQRGAFHAEGDFPGEVSGGAFLGRPQGLPGNWIRGRTADADVV